MGVTIICYIKHHILILSLAFSLWGCAHTMETHDDAIPIDDIILNAEQYHGKKVKFRAYVSTGLLPYTKTKQIWIGGINLTKEKIGKCPVFIKDPRFNKYVNIIGTPKSNKDYFKIRKFHEDGRLVYVEAVASGVFINEPKLIYAITEIEYTHQIEDIKILQIKPNTCRL